MSNFIHWYENETFTYTLRAHFENFVEETSVYSVFFAKIDAFPEYIEKLEVRPN
jgi:hypothetical protein